jgi:hypothetical protein
MGALAVALLLATVAVVVGVLVADWLNQRDF